MPITWTTPPTTPGPSAGPSGGLVGGWRGRQARPLPGEPVVEPDEIVSPDEADSGVSLPAVVAGGAGLAGLAYGASKLAKLPGVLGRLGTAAATANALRQQLMLSGFAPLKSLLGNVGAGLEAAVE